MPAAFAAAHSMCGSGRTDRADEVIAALADAQHGVVSRTQLIAVGVTERQIDYRLRRKRLRKIHLGVYAVGHRALKPEGVWMAAVLAAGEGAVLSHWSADAIRRSRSISAT